MIALNGYTIAEHLSQSSSTGIYRGVRLSDQVPVILKVLDVEFPSPIELARIRHEYELAKSLSHPGVIKVHALEKHHHSLAIAMEDFGGIPLRALITQNALSIEDKLRIALRISEILGDIHRDGIIHKDINPNNILINPQSGEIKIIDFGIAAQLDHEDQQLIHPDQLEGILAYIAPEQTGRMNRQVDYRSDYYSLGITLYELLLNRPPFEAQDSMEMVHLHIASVPPSLHSQEPSIPLIASRIVEKLIEKNAENRYQSAFGICKDLEACILALSFAAPDEDFVPGTRDVSDRFSIPAKLYGRDTEIKRLMAAYECVCDGQPGVVLVTGYSGIGKSSLIHEIHKPIAKRRGFFIAGKFDQYRRNIPYSALIQAFQSLLHQLLTQSDECIALWRERLLDALGENAQVIVEVLPELRHILGDQPDVPPLAPQEAQNRFNYYLVNFVQIFAQAEHPLTLFLDDLQWADHPSLNLLELLCTGSGCTHQMIIGAYRHNEVDAAHPLQLALARMSSGGVSIDEIALQVLAPEVVCQIVADTFKCEADKTQQLAALVYRKTDGNPFFINQLLKNLYDSRLVSYSAPDSKWVWDIAQIDRVGISDNVVELMMANIRKLPAATQRLMNLAACIGNPFTLETLSVISEKSRDAVAQDLREALQTTLIVPIGSEYKFFGNTALAYEHEPREFDVQYRFQHDRIQQAAHDLLSAEEKIDTHFKVGNLLLENTPDTLLDEKIFDIVNHFDQSTQLATDPALRLRLAELNIKAAIRAKNAIAYASALNYITVAQEFLGGLAQGNRQLQFRILAERAECEHLNGNGEAAENFYQQALSKAANENEQALIFEAMIHFHTNAGNFKLAYNTGRQALKLFGVSLPASFIPPLFLADLVRAKWRMRGKKIADLIDLPVCQDEKLRTAMRLIGALLKAAYQIRPELCIANAVKAVNLSLKHGTTEDNAVAYVVFGGIFIGGVMGKHQAGYEFGKLALAMNDRFDNLKQRSEVNFVSGYFTDFWLKPARHTEESYRAAYQSGLQTGDFFHLSCAVCTLVESQYIRGVPLAEVKKLGGDYLEFMQRINSREAAGAITATLRAILNLQGMTASPASFGDIQFNEAQFVERIQGFASLHFSHFYFVNKMQTLYLWRHYDEALKVAQTSEKYLKYSLAMLHTVEHHFYHALILCAVYAMNKNATHLGKARKILHKFERWAQLNPANFAHKALLIRAEVERLSNGGWKVPSLYAKAIQSADENGYMQNKALGNELAGRFFASKNIDAAARGHLREAYYDYQLWGAQGIADKLAQEFPQAADLRVPEALSGAGTAELSGRKTSLPFADRSTSHSGSRDTTSTSRRKSSLDLETVIKSTQAISGEIKLSTLLQKLLRIMIENAGAEKGCFIRVEQGQLLLEAEGSVHQEEVHILGGIALDGTRLPASIVQYVARIGESVVLNDAQSDARFWDDPYVVQTQPQSLLCAPVLHQGQVVGVVCLENNLTRGAFTPDRLELLKVLSAQAAISIENSLLYVNLERRVTERTQELSLATEKLQAANEAFQSKTEQVSNLLNNSGQGFLSFGADRVIDTEYSRACETMLGESPSGRDAAEVFFHDDKPRADLFCTITSSVQAESDPCICESMLSLLPTEIQRENALLKAEYKVLENGKFMVILTDITENKGMEALLKSERHRLEMIVMAVSDSRNFFDTSDAFCEFLAHGLPSMLNGTAAPQILAKALYREIHTYKGVLNQFSFPTTPTVLHDIETGLSGLLLLGDTLTRQKIAELVASEILQPVFDKDLAILTDALGKEFLANRKEIILSDAQAQQLEKLAKQLLRGETIDTSVALTLLNQIRTLRELPIGDVLMSFSGIVKQVAERMEKDVAPLEVTGGADVWINPKHYQAFFRSLVHVFRNAVAHGLETPDGRWEAKKDEAGKITCSVAVEGDTIKLVIADDGAGINLDALRERAVATGIYGAGEVQNVPDEEIARLIFMDNISTQKEVTELAGRGVGLAAVLNETKNLGGEVLVKTVAGGGTQFLFNLPWLQESLHNEVRS